MSSSQSSSLLESEIRQFFAETGDVSHIADRLLKRWDANVLSDDDVRVLSRFMLAAGLEKEWLTQLQRSLTHGRRVPWGALAEVIDRAPSVTVDAGFELQPIEVDAFFEGLAEQSAEFQADMMFELVESFGVDHIDPRPAEFRAQKVAHLRRLHVEKRADLQRRLEYARANRLLSQEKRLLDEIQAFDPSDVDLSFERNDLAFREAQEIVENALAQSEPKSEIERKFSKLSPELRAAAEPILERVRELALTVSEPELYDMALMLLFMDLHDESAQLLESHRLSSRIDWLLLETLILAKQFAAALGEIEGLEIKYAGESEAPFALTYARARALWGLGETATAIELMKSLTRVRPTYRSASTLLQQWLEEAP